jgi:predicted nucleic-acid-binding Zn-ribbon protein
MNSAFRKALAINEINSVDTILKRFLPTVGMNEGDHEALTKTLKSTSQMQVTGETDEIIIDLSDRKNIHVTEFNTSYFELYFNIDIDVFQGRFPILPTNALLELLTGDAAWTD